MSDMTLTEFLIGAVPGEESMSVGTRFGNPEKQNNMITKMEDIMFLPKYLSITIIASKSS
jgi:hypothetical protein